MTTKHSEKLLFYLLCLTMFIAALNQNIYSPLIPLLQTQFNVSIHWINLASGTFIFVFALMQITAGWMVDHKNLKKLYQVCMVATIISTLVVAFTDSFVLFFIFRVLQAISTAAFPLITVKMATLLFKGARKDDALATYQIVISLAPAVAPLLGSYIGAKFGYQSIFYGLAFISILLFAISSRMFLTVATTQTTTNRGVLKLRSYWSCPISCFIFISSFLLFLIYFAQIIHLPILLTQTYEVELKHIGVLYMPLTISMVLGSYLFKKLPVSIRKSQWLFYHIPIVLLSANLLYAFFATQSLVTLSLLLLVIGFHLGLLPVIYSTKLTDQYLENSAQVMSIYNLIRYAGMGLGGVLAGVAFLNLIFVTSSLLILFLLVWIMLASKKVE